MRGFHPTIRTIHPPLPADPAGVAVSTALSRDIGYRLTWDLPRVLFSGIITAGIMPLIILLLRWRRFATADVFQLEHVVEWLDRRNRAGRELHDLLARVRAGITPLIFAGFAATAVSFGVGVLHIVTERFSVTSLVSLLTVYYPLGMSVIYMLLVSAAFVGCHWGAIHLHAYRMRRFVKAFNATNPLDSEIALQPPPRLILPTMPWVVGGIGLLLAGCIWGLPMMLAAGAHKRYTSDMASQIRTPIAQRIRQLVPSDMPVLTAGVD